MVNKKNNVPYYIVGSLATLALLASGVFAAAPYVQVQFLAPIAALGLSAPLIAVCAAFSAVVIAFSAIVVNKNRTLSKKETLLAEKAKEVKDKDVVISCVNERLAEKDVIIASMKDQLATKDRELKDQDVVISYVDEQLAKKNRMLRGEDDKSADSLFNDHNDDAQHKLKKARQDKFDILVAKRKQEEASVLSNQSPIALAYKDAKIGPNAQEGERFYDAKIGPDAQEGERFYDAKIGPDAQPVETPKQTGSGLFSPRQVLGVGAVFGFACLLAQRSISSIGAIPLADNLLNPSSIMDGIAANFYAIHQIYT